MMRLVSSRRFLAIYSGILTLAFAATILTGFAQHSRTGSFEQIDVQRINIVGPDGKNQLVIANNELIPEAIIDGKTFPSHGRHDGAGMIFYNNEGDEDGGMGFSYHKTANGWEADGELMFDQYKQDQTVGIQYSNNSGKRQAGFRVWDRPGMDLAQIVEHFDSIKNMPAGPQKDAAMKQLQQQAKNGEFGATRFFAAKTPDKNAVVILSDAKIDFLDENGKVTYSLPQQSQ